MAGILLFLLFSQLSNLGFYLLVYTFPVVIIGDSDTKRPAVFTGVVFVDSGVVAADDGDDVLIPFKA